MGGALLIPPWSARITTALSMRSNGGGGETVRCQWHGMIAHGLRFKSKVFCLPCTDHHDDARRSQVLGSRNSSRVIGCYNGLLSGVQGILRVPAFCHGVDWHDWVEVGMGLAVKSWIHIAAWVDRRFSRSSRSWRISTARYIGRRG